eukprot:767257-Hanusia_phi.AAC.3
MAKIACLQVSGATEADVRNGEVMKSLTPSQQQKVFLRRCRPGMHMMVAGCQVEADCYHCLTNMLDNAQDNYVLDSKGIQEKVFKLKRIISRLDEKLVQHLESNDVEFLQVPLSQTLPLPCLPPSPHLLTQLPSSRSDGSTAFSCESSPWNALSDYGTLTWQTNPSRPSTSTSVPPSCFPSQRSSRK